MAAAAPLQELHLCEEARWMQSRHAPGAAPDDGLDGIADESKLASSELKVRLKQPLWPLGCQCALSFHMTRCPFHEVGVQGLRVQHALCVCTLSLITSKAMSGCHSILLGPLGALLLACYAW